MDHVRNQITVQLFGGTKVLRGNHEAMLMMEANAEIGLMQLCMKSGYLSYKEVVAILHAGLHGAGEKKELSEVGELVLEHGFTNCFKIANQLLLVLFKSPVEKKTPASKQPKALKK